MITIGLTVCDNDYENCQKVLDQIKHKVKVKHEVVIIDNREKFKDVKTKWKPTYSFGYNAYQFAARTKIIEYAKGDYLRIVLSYDGEGISDATSMTNIEGKKAQEIAKTSSLMKP